MTYKFIPRLMALTAAAAFVSASGTATAAEYATREEAVSFVKKVITFYKASSREKALADISAKDNKFVDRELYVTVMDIKTGVAAADSRNPRLVGKNLSELKDADGKSFVREQMYMGKTGSASWIDYRWPNPVTQVIESKTTYCEPYDGLIFCVGIYRGV